MIYLALGSNLGDSCTVIQEAIEFLKKKVEIHQVSSFYTSQAWGFESQETFYNIVLSGDTSLKPIELLDFVKNIEQEMGRQAKPEGCRYADRIIDIDIIAYHNLHLVSEQLNIPHLLMQDRNFVLNPLVEIAPDWIHPVLLKTSKVLQKECKDTVASTKIGN